MLSDYYPIIKSGCFLFLPNFFNGSPSSNFRAMSRGVKKKKMIPPSVPLSFSTGSVVLRATMPRKHTSTRRNGYNRASE